MENPDVDDVAVGRPTVAAMPPGNSVPGIASLRHIADLLQEAVILLTADASEPTRHYRVLYANPVAARALRVELAELAGRVLAAVTPADTATVLYRLCERASRHGSVEQFAAAPDPLTDLTGTSTVTVRLSVIDEGILLTWLPGVMFDPDAPRPGIALVSDRLELASTWDSVGDGEIGVFSVDLTTGRTVWSRGMYEIFGRVPDDGPAHPMELIDAAQSRFGPADVWRALVEDCRSITLDLPPATVPSGRRVQLTAHAARGRDGFPAVVRGQCRVMAGADDTPRNGYHG